MCMCVHICVQARRHSQLLFLGEEAPSFGDRVSHWSGTGKSQGGSYLPSSGIKDPSPTLLPVLGRLAIFPAHTP